MTFRALLKRLKKHYPSVRAFAYAIDVDPSHLSRAMSATGQPFDVRGCLRLAVVTGANPADVLRAAGKTEIADLIEQLYGAPQVLLTPEQQELLAAFSAILDPVVRQSLITLARSSGTGGGGSIGGEGSGEPGPGGVLPPRKEPDYTMRDDPRHARTGR
jgi:hypothetical protein